MEKSGGNGHDPGTVQMVEILQRLEGKVDGLRVGLDELRGELIAFKTEVRSEFTAVHHEIADTNVRVTDLAAEVHDTNVRLTETNAKLAGVATEVHEIHTEMSDHGARLGVLEAAVFKRAG